MIDQLVLQRKNRHHRILDTVSILEPTVNLADSNYIIDIVEALLWYFRIVPTTESNHQTAPAAGNCVLVCRV
jgi:hypothetical protein